MAKKWTRRKRSLAAKKGWKTRRENLKRVQSGELNRREVGVWYQKQIDQAVEKAVKEALAKEKNRLRREIQKEQKKAEKKPRRPRKTGTEEEERLRRINRNLKERLRRAEEKLHEEEEISKSPRKWIETKIDWLWDNYGRDGKHPRIKYWIERLAKKFSWPKDDLWHWYYSPTWK